MNPERPIISLTDAVDRPVRPTFGNDFRRFFLRGLAAVLPTLITISVMLWLWEFLWVQIGRRLIVALRTVVGKETGLLPYQPAPYIRWLWQEDSFVTRLVGVVLAILLIYIVGVLVGNFIGRAMWRLAEDAVLRIPVIRAIYPSVKQVTDFLLADKKSQFVGTRVVAVQPHEKGIWSIGLVTGPGVKALGDAVGKEMLTVFVPSSPTAFSGYVMVVPRDGVVELPLTVEEAMRLLVSGGVIQPPGTPPITQAVTAGVPTQPLVTAKVSG